MSLVVAAGLLTGMAATLAPTADAMCVVGVVGACNPGLPSPSVANNPNYKGWGYVSATGMAGGPIRIFDAWRWNGTQWVHSTRAQDQQVYIYPFASGWTWTWSSGSGWLAMHSTDLRIGSVPVCRAICPL
jgi:hypothetical protein